MYFRLAWRSIVNEPIRFASAVFGIAAATALITWHVGLAMTALHSGEAAANRALAPFEAWDNVRGATPRTSTLGSATERGATQLAIVAGILDVRPGGHVLQGPPLRATIAPLPERGIPFEFAELEGRLPEQVTGKPEIVVSEGLFGRRVAAPPLDSPLAIILARGAIAPTVTGYFTLKNQPRGFPTIYANKAAMQTILRLAPVASTLFLYERGVAPRSVAEPREEVRGVAPRSVAEPRVEVRGVAPRSVAEPRVEVRGVAPRTIHAGSGTIAAHAASLRSDTVNNLLASLPMTLVLVLIASAAMVSTTLLADMALRRTRLAALRCIGATRGGLVRLVAWEGGIIAIAGWLLGTCASWLLLWLFLRLEHGGELPPVPHFGWQTPLAGLALALLSAGASMAVPVAAILRVRPLEALNTPQPSPPRNYSRRSALAILLMLPMPVISVLPGITSFNRILLMAIAGIPAFTAGIIIALVPLIGAIEKIALPALSRIFKLEPTIVKGRLTRAPLRVAGTVLSISLCLAAFCAIHIWGGTLMSSFVPSPEWPDAIVSILPNGWSQEQLALAAQSEGIENNTLIPIDCTQKPFDRDSPAFAGRESEIPNGQVLLFGVNPAAAYGGAKPFAPFRFIAGKRETAIRAMENGRGCVIAAMLARMAKLDIGDRIRFAGRELEIAGIIELNWHMVTSRSLVRTQYGHERAVDSRKGDVAVAGDMAGSRAPAGAMSAPSAPPGRTIGMVLVSEEFVRSITGNTRTYFAWLGMTPALDALGGLASTVVLDNRLNAALPPDGASEIQVHHRDEIADGTLAHGNDILGAMARIPFWSLAVAATGIVALLLAGVQASLPELRTMRAVGMTASQLSRMLMTEAALVTISALILGLVAGAIFGWSFTGLSRWMAVGLPVRIVLPWRTLLKGMGFCLAMCAIMSILPLLHLVKTLKPEP